MQQHPFGPIENQLIVGYYKRGVAVSNLKPAFKVKEVVMEGQNGQILGWTPDFYGWSPANGNSSSHDFRVDYMPSTNDWSESLLSRGLGYRITFTMPDQKRGGKKNTAAPEFELEIVDFMGERVLRRFEDNNQKNFEGLEDEIQDAVSKHKSFQIEVTPLHLKIVENGTIEHYSPFYQQPGTPNLIDREALFSKFDWLVEEENYEQNSEENYEETTGLPFDSGFRHHLKGTFQALSRVHAEISPSARSGMREHLMVLIDTFTRCCYADKEHYLRKDPSMLRFLDTHVAGLDTKLQGWLDGVGDYPLHLNAAFIESICQRLTPAYDREDLEDNYMPECKFEEAALAGGHALENFLFLSMEKLPKILRSYTFSMIQVGLSYTHECWTRFRTNTFTVRCFGLVSEQVPFQYFDTVERQQLLEINIKPKIRTNLTYNGPVIPVYGTDLLLGCAAQRDLRRRCFIVDLSATLKTRDKTGSQASIKAIEGALLDSVVEDERVFASARGICLLGIKKEEVCAFLQFHSLIQKTKNWAYLELGKPQGRFNNFTTGSVLQQTRTGQIFAFFGMEDVRTGAGLNPYWTHNLIKLACCRYNNNTLAVVYQTTLEWTGSLPHYQSVWIESSNAVYACIFSCSPPIVWVATNQRHRFVAVGSKSASKLKAFDLSDRLESLQPLRAIRQTVGIMGKFRLQGLSDVSDTYKLGKLFFRY